MTTGTMMSIREAAAGFSQRFIFGWGWHSSSVFSSSARDMSWTYRARMLEPEAPELGSEPEPRPERRLGVRAEFAAAESPSTARDRIPDTAEEDVAEAGEPERSSRWAITPITSRLGFG